jgi:hypothetical protein
MVTEDLSVATAKYLIAVTAFTAQATGGCPTGGWVCQVKSLLLPVAVDWLTEIR